MNERKPKPAPRDLALLHGPTEDGKGARLLRFRGGQVTAGEIRPAREGVPIGPAELVRLKPVHRELPLCEVEVLHDPKAAEEQAAPERASSGPARVSTQRYRRNWNAVFGDKAEREPAREPRRNPDYSIN